MCSICYRGYCARPDMGGCLWRDSQGSQAWRSSESDCLPSHSSFSDVVQFGVYEWAMTDRWDPSIPEHKALAHEIEFGNGIPEMRPLSKAREALKTVGFEIEHEEDLAERDDPVPWYYPLEGDISKAQTAWDYITVWRMSWSGKLVSHTAMRVMEWFGLLPKGTYDVGEALKVAGDSLVRGGQTKVSILLISLLTSSPDSWLFSSYLRPCILLSVASHVKTEHSPSLPLSLPGSWSFWQVH